MKRRFKTDNIYICTFFFLFKKKNFERINLEQISSRKGQDFSTFVKRQVILFNNNEKYKGSVGKQINKS